MEKDKNSFLIACVSCIVVLLLICYFGINSDFTKGTFASGSCPSGKVLTGDGEFCCPNSTDVIKTEGSKTYCVNPGSADSDSITLVSSTETESGKACLISNITLENNDTCSSKFGESWVASGTPVYNGKGQIVVNCSSQCAVLAEAVTPTVTKYTVTYNANGGTVSKTSDEVESGKTTQLPTATKTGYTFNGWYDAATGGTKKGDAGASYTVTSNITLYAQWTANTPTSYTINYDANGGNVTPTSVNVESGKTVTLPTPTRSGYTFNGWYTAASGGTKIGNAGASYTVTSNITLYAQWTANTPTVTKYTVTYNANGGTASKTSDEVESGKTTQLPTATKTGYTFNGWYDAATGGTKKGDAGASYTVTSNITLYAQWTQNTPTNKIFNANFNANGGKLNGSANKSCNTTGSNCSISDLPSASKDGYIFKGWGTSKTCTSGSTSTLTLNKADTTFYACYLEDSVDENPQTGSITIFIVWVIGLAAIVYSIWYFKKNNV